MATLHVVAKDPADDRLVVVTNSNLPDPSPNLSDEAKRDHAARNEETARHRVEAQGFVVSSIENDHAIAKQKADAANPKPIDVDFVPPQNLAPGKVPIPVPRSVQATPTQTPAEQG